FPEEDGLLAYDADAKSGKRHGASAASLGLLSDHNVPGLPDGAALRFGRFQMRQLALVLKLIETGNLHDAAAALYMSQPAATKLLQEIEEALGAALFIRQSRGIKPTPCGI